MSKKRLKTSIESAACHSSDKHIASGHFSQQFLQQPNGLLYTEHEDSPQLAQKIINLRLLNLFNSFFGGDMLKEINGSFTDLLVHIDLESNFIQKFYKLQALFENTELNVAFQCRSSTQFSKQL